MSIVKFPLWHSDHRPGLLQTFPEYVCLTHARHVYSRQALSSCFLDSMSGRHEMNHSNSYTNPKRKGNAVEGSGEPDLARKTLKKPDLSRDGEAVGRASE